ncbi:MAG: leucine-rich repeat domain-containing protein, partial [Clostridiales bacterium]|nr:leucine-rich repeat domain-containing protein [Clostridiales bacterium]
NGNKKITKVTIGKNVTKIGKKAFYNCKNLKKITIKSTKLKAKNISAKAFTKAGSSNYKKLVVKVPKGKVSSYKKMLKKKGLSAKATVKK